MSRRRTSLWARLLLSAALALVTVPLQPDVAAAVTTTGPLHTNGVDTVIYNSSNEPVRLRGFNWSGMESGGRSDFLKAPDVCGATWRTPADRLPGLTITYDDLYQNLRNWGYNVIRLPIQWHNLEPIPPTWDAQAGRYVHSWNPNYLNDLRSMVTKARAAGIMVILDMQQDFWSPALHNITNWDGSPGYCEGYGMPRWMYPSIDAKPATTQNTDFYNGMNWFFRNIHDPMATVTRATPWELYGDVWRMLSREFSAASGFPDHQAVVGADLFNEPWWSYVGGNPPAGMSVAQAAGSRLLTFYTQLAPAITTDNPSWLLFFQDTGGGYYSANPSLRESPWMTGKPSAPGNWVYSLHEYNFTYATFSDGVPRHDDFGIHLMNAALANARAWGVPLYIGEFTNFSLGVDARNLTDADMEQTRLFLDWARQNGVSWTFWSYCSPYRPMTMMDYSTNRPITAVKNALDTGLDGPADPNLPPVASFTSSADGLQVALDGSPSSDPDGTVASWSWSFGDGRTGTGANPTVTYPSGGTYTVVLTVTDDRGATASTSKAVTVTGQPGGLYASDTFSRTVTNGWGTAELGGAWSLSGGTTSFSVAGGAGRLSVAPGSTSTASLNAVQQTSVEVTTTVSFDRAQTGGGTYLSVIGRRVSAGNAYQLKTRVQPNGALTAQLVRVVNGAETVLQSVPTVAGVSWTQGEKIRIRLRVNGTTPSALAARIWEDGAAEPAGWHLTASDSTPSLQANGGLGISTYLSTSATQSPMVVSVDELVAGPLPGTPPPGNVDPVASFTRSCAGLACTLDGSASRDPDGTITSYAWTFGDGGTGTGPTVSHTYASAGTYPVVLTTTDNQGATGSSTQTVTVAPSPPATAHAADTFTRTVSGGWGTADVGGVWSSGSPASLSVSGGMGAMTMATPGSGPSVFLPSASSTSTDLRITARTDKPATGGGVYLSVMARRVPSAGDYRAKVRLQSNSQVTVQLVRVAANGTETALSPVTTVAGLTYDVAIGVRIRVQATGTSPTTFRARVWSASAAEPSTWHATLTDSTSALQAAGGIGLAGYLSGTATNAPVVARFDDLSATPVP